MTMFKIGGKFSKDERGGVIAYAAVFSMLAVGAGAVAMDFGRMTLLRAEMQNRADAGAMAGARFLDGRDGARDRAEEVAVQAMTEHSNISTSDELSIQSVNFFASLNPDVAATDDLGARFVRVTLEPRDMDLYLHPVLDRLADTPQQSTQTVNAFATAGSLPFICNAPPLMICDFKETSPDDNLRLTSNIGRQVRLKEPPSGGNQAWAPGNFSPLALPDGSSGASDVGEALAAVEQQECYNINVETAPGGKTNQIKDGINSRFDIPGNPYPYPAPNVINYPRDAALIADDTATLGNGNWDQDTYWSDKHDGDTVPTDIEDGTRYQTYLYETGETFWRNGKETVYPVPSGETAPSGWNEVTGMVDGIPEDEDNADDPNYDGEPSETVASNGAMRRVTTVAQLQCIADDVHGSGTYPTNGNYIEVFITEYMLNPPNTALYGEVIRALSPLNSPEFFANVDLVE